MGDVFNWIFPVAAPPKPPPYVPKAWHPPTPKKKDHTGKDD